MNNETRKELINKIFQKLETSSESINYMIDAICEMKGNLYYAYQLLFLATNEKTIKHIENKPE